MFFRCLFIILLVDVFTFVHRMITSIIIIFVIIIIIVVVVVVVVHDFTNWLFTTCVVTILSPEKNQRLSFIQMI